MTNPLSLARQATQPASASGAISTAYKQNKALVSHNRSIADPISRLVHGFHPRPQRRDLLLRV